MRSGEENVRQVKESKLHRALCLLRLGYSHSCKTAKPLKPRLQSDRLGYSIMSKKTEVKRAKFKP